MSHAGKTSLMRRSGREVAAERPKTLDQIGVTNLVDVGTHIEGRAVFHRSCFFKGEANGVIEIKSPGQLLIVARQASIEGEIKAESVVVQGTVKGHIRCKNIKFFPGSNFEGELEYERIAISPDANVNARAMQKVEYVPDEAQQLDKSA
jgi:cytoskeletal protein CcmA (bactofilin family)